MRNNLDAMKNTKKTLVHTLRKKKNEGGAEALEQIEEPTGGGEEIGAPVLEEVLPASFSNLPMLPNERIVSSFSGLLWAYDIHAPDAMRTGVAYVTNADFGFLPDEDVEGFRVPLQLISNINKIGNRKGKAELYFLTIALHDFRVLRLALPKLLTQRSQLFDVLHEAAFVDSLTKFFAFDRDKIGKGAGWSVYVAEQEWKRQFERLQQGQGRWRICVNADYKICATYPKVLSVPTSVDDALGKALYSMETLCVCVHADFL
jgi:hypothetical protein